LLGIHKWEPDIYFGFSPAFICSAYKCFTEKPFSIHSINPITSILCGPKSKLQKNMFSLTLSLFSKSPFPVLLVSCSNRLTRREVLLLAPEFWETFLSSFPGQQSFLFLNKRKERRGTDPEGFIVAALFPLWRN
jgi:hypothetical protein